MTASERKRLGLHYAKMSENVKAKHPTLEAYYIEFQDEIDKELN